MRTTAKYKVATNQFGVTKGQPTNRKGLHSIRFQSVSVDETAEKEAPSTSPFKQQSGKDILSFMPTPLQEYLRVRNNTVNYSKKYGWDSNNAQ